MMAAMHDRAATALPINIICSFPDHQEAARWARDLQSALGQAARVSVWSDRVTDADADTDTEAEADIAVVWKPTQAFFDVHTRLSHVFAAGAGVDALLKLRLPASAQVVRLEDAGMGAQMAEYVSYGVLRFFREFDVYESQAQRRTWQAREPQRRSDWPVGILGYGALGQPVAQALQAMGFPVQAWARSAKPDAGVRVYTGAQQLGEFLRATRVLVCMLPLTPETRHIIRAETLAQLPRGACLINVARGGHVHESDLIAALDSGHLQGALLDVCDTEPAPSDHPLWSQPRITLTPHIAAATLREESIAQIARKIGQLSRGEPITGVIGAAGY
jgi:glyoxylate/hydroxypyruvate reductase